MLPLLSKSALLVFGCDYASANGTEGGVGGAGDGAINPRLNYARGEERQARENGEIHRDAFMPGIVKHAPPYLGTYHFLACIGASSVEMSYGFKHLNSMYAGRESEMAITCRKVSHAM